MEAWLLDWLNLLGRWTHLVTGVAWIGASFYFVWLDNHLLSPRAPEDEQRGIGGELWAVHGGGFYHARKFRVAPSFLPSPLHWFKWEAYSTWLSGMFLLVLIYWVGADLYLIDPHVAQLTHLQAVVLAAAVIVCGWLVYDVLCRSPLGRDNRQLGLVLAVLVAGLAFALCQVFSGRGAFMHFGAVLGSIMVGNVFFVIIPGQRELVAACREGRAPDPGPALKARQRSVHNTYFTLPVLFVMISNHYAGIHGHAWNWLLLIGLSLAGAAIRVWFVQRHFGRNAWPALLVAGVSLIAVGAATLPSAPPRVSAAVDVAAVSRVVEARCTPCHARQPTQPGFMAPPQGVVLESPADVRRHAERVRQQAVVSRAMPPGNLTGMTEQERRLLENWIAGGF